MTFKSISNHLVSMRANKQARCSSSPRELSAFAFRRTCSPWKQAQASGPTEIPRTLRAAANLGLAPPEAPAQIPSPLIFLGPCSWAQSIPHWPPRDTHHPLGCGGSVGSASSRPGWDSGWRPGVGQLTSMWSHSYQNLHCSQKFHPDQGQRR